MTRRVAFAALVAGAALLAGGYVAWKASADPRPSEVGSAGATQVGRGRIVFQNVVRDAGYAKVSWVPIAEPGTRRALSDRVCERVHFAAERGICLVPRRNVLGQSYDALVLDERLRGQRKISLPGIISRARVSPDGRFAAATGFVSGDSYADEGFSTRTFILDLREGKLLANLEDYAVFRDGKQIRSIDFNFWGVTFARGGNRFYATLATRGKTYLVRGDVEKERVDVVREGVECPSLSPDGTRIAFKRRVGEAEWRLSVLDLATLVETPLAETRSVDDQAEWLDDDEVLYGLAGSVWAVAANGKGSPRKLIPDGLSPAVVR